MFFEIQFFRLIRRHWLCILFLVGFGWPVSAADVVITINSDESKVANSLVTISDIAKVTSANRQLSESVGLLDLELLNSEGDQATITRKQIQMRVRVSNLRVNSVTVRGNLSTQVTRASSFAPEKAIKEAIVKAISQQFDVTSSDIRVGITLDSSKSELNELANSIRTAIVVLPAELPIGNTDIRFVYQTNQQTDKSMDMACDITILAEMLIAKQNIPRGKKLDSSDVKLVKRPVNRKSPSPATLTSAIGKKASRNIPIRGVIKVSDLANVEREFVVKRNDLVDAVYEVNGITARLSNAKALQSGRVGDRIEIFFPDTSTKFTASVVNESTVKVR